MAYITFEQIKNDSTVATYIRQADIALKAYGYTEHSFPHVTRAAKIAAKILGDFGYPQREVELAQIAGFLHDIGNCINRVDHAQSGALMAFHILTSMGMPPEEVRQNHRCNRQSRRVLSRSGQRCGCRADSGGQNRRPPFPGPQPQYRLV